MWKQLIAKYERRKGSERVDGGIEQVNCKNCLNTAFTKEGMLCTAADCSNKFSSIVPELVDRYITDRHSTTLLNVRKRERETETTSITHSKYRMLVDLDTGNLYDSIEDVASNHYESIPMSRYEVLNGALSNSSYSSISSIINNVSITMDIRSAEGRNAIIEEWKKDNERIEREEILRRHHPLHNLSTGQYRSNCYTDFPPVDYSFSSEYEEIDDLVPYSLLSPLNKSASLGFATNVVENGHFAQRMYKKTNEHLSESKNVSEGSRYKKSRIPVLIRTYSPRSDILSMAHGSMIDGITRDTSSIRQREKNNDIAIYHTLEASSEFD